MKVIIIGLGTQGKKRKKILEKSKELVATVDNKVKAANFKNLIQLQKSKIFFDTVFICCPDKYKLRYLNFFINKDKNILVEKPLFISNKKLIQLTKKIKSKKTKLYIAYNHRFEPFFEFKKNLLVKKKLNNIYLVRMFYGNGTSILVKKSWRSKNLSILEDLGSHLIDLCIFWYGQDIKFLSCKSYKLENKFYDYFELKLKIKKIIVLLEATYCSWKNTFFLNTVCKKNYLRINSLCKWKKPSLTIANRVYPSGAPQIKRFTKNISDPTWKKEIDYFRNYISAKNNKETIKMLN